MTNGVPVRAGEMRELLIERLGSHAEGVARAEGFTVFVPGALNFVLCYTLIPIYGYRIAIYSTIVSFWSQLAIPFVVKYYRRSVGEWLGDRRWIVVILVAVLADLLIANELMTVVIGWKVLLSIVALTALWGFHRRLRIQEL